MIVLYTSFCCNEILGSVEYLNIPPELSGDETSEANAAEDEIRVTIKGSSKKRDNFAFIRKILFKKLSIRCGIYSRSHPNGRLNKKYHIKALYSREFFCGHHRTRHVASTLSQYTRTPLWLEFTMTRSRNCIPRLLDKSSNFSNLKREYSHFIRTQRLQQTQD